MSKTLCTIAGWSLGVLMCLGLVIFIAQVSPEQHAIKVDRCVASAVRTYPKLAGREMKVAELKACRGLTDAELNSVRSDLQDFGVEAATRVAAGQ